MSVIEDFATVTVAGLPYDPSIVLNYGSDFVICGLLPNSE
jgi:hypothetical protein